MKIIEDKHIKCGDALLRIIWHKSEYGLYWHRAFIDIPYESDSLFTPTIVKIEVRWCVATIKDGLKIGSTNYKKSVYLPCKITCGVLSTALDDAKLLDVLALNTWTKGQKSSPKEYPISLSVSYDDKSFVWDFNIIEGETPHLLCQPYLPLIDEKQEFIIKLN